MDLACCVDENKLLVSIQRKITWIYIYVHVLRHDKVKTSMFSVENVKDVM